MHILSHGFLLYQNFLKIVTKPHHCDTHYFEDKQICWMVLVDSVFLSMTRLVWPASSVKWQAQQYKIK